MTLLSLWNEVCILVERVVDAALQASLRLELGTNERGKRTAAGGGLLDS